MREHIVTSFETDIKDLHEKVQIMGQYVEKVVEDSFLCFTNKDDEFVQKTIASDITIDELEAQIIDGAFEILARRAPVAGDLRKIISAIRIASNFERAGDHAKNNTKRIRAIKPDNYQKIVNLLSNMNNLALSKIHNVVVAYSNNDTDLAELIIQTDIEIDEMFKEIFIELTSESTKKNDILTSQDLANFIIIAKSLERIGDHATNVAEIIIFQSKGIIPSKDLRSS